MLNKFDEQFGRVQLAVFAWVGFCAVLSITFLLGFVYLLLTYGIPILEKWAGA